MRTFSSDERKKIDSLTDKPYSEMTEDEIGLIIEWKSNIKAKEEQFKQTLKLMDDANEAVIAEQKKRTELARQTQTELLERSRKRLEASE